jgi:hypothetical protein
MRDFFAGLSRPGGIGGSNALSRYIGRIEGGSLKVNPLGLRKGEPVDG